MDLAGVRANFDEQLRRGATADSPDGWIEYDECVTRSLSSGGGWSGVTWSRLGDKHGADVDALIAAQVERFAEAGPPWEWKHYSWDQPADLPARLLAAGLTPDPSEAVLVAEIADLDLTLRAPPGLTLRSVVDQRDVDLLVAVHDEVFGGDHAPIGRVLTAAIAAHPPTAAAVLALAGDSPVSSGRLDLHHGTDFASLWGGGTMPAWRGRGAFRALVTHRAATAAQTGFRYLQVDATADSSPILQRLGFSRLGTVTAYARPGFPAAFPP